MRFSIVLSAVLALLVAGQALGANTVNFELLLGGDNHAADWKAPPAPTFLPTPYSGGDASDGQILDRTADAATHILNWAATVTADTGLGPEINGLANIVFDLSVEDDQGQVVDLPAGPADCLTGPHTVVGNMSHAGRIVSTFEWCAQHAGIIR